MRALIEDLKMNQYNHKPTFTYFFYMYYVTRLTDQQTNELFQPYFLNRS